MEGVHDVRNLLEKGYSYVRRFLLQRNTLFSSPEMPQQQSYTPEQRYAPPEYRGAPSGFGYPQQGGVYPQQGYPQQGYAQQEGMPSQENSRQQGGVYPQQGYPQRGGMNPWITGGLGALGGGLAGYGIGQAVGEMQQDAHGDYHPADGQGDYADSGSTGEDFGGGDFGGGDFGGE